MTIEVAKEKIADILEVDQTEIEEDKVLSDFDTWDSIAVLAVISVVGEERGVFLHANEIGKIKTVKELIQLLMG